MTFKDLNSLFIHNSNRSVQEVGMLPTKTHRSTWRQMLTVDPYIVFEPVATYETRPTLVVWETNEGFKDQMQFFF